ncbi:hypothetical protein ABC347_10945 [Sphingomonas sp. 1P06PA]|uniref:hypothetical protein n=1 Tax=Sphingomonas sp. 1P06PA TaxID=554121 RepID=UPI0039A63E20
MREGIQSLIEGVAVLGALIGAFFIYAALALSEAAPAQGALAAIGVGFAVIPYTVAAIGHRRIMRRSTRQP